MGSRHEARLARKWGADSDLESGLAESLEELVDRGVYFRSGLRKDLRVPTVRNGIRHFLSCNVPDDHALRPSTLQLENRTVGRPSLAASGTDPRPAALVAASFSSLNHTRGFGRRLRDGFKEKSPPIRRDPATDHKPRSRGRSSRCQYASCGPGCRSPARGTIDKSLGSVIRRSRAYTTLAIGGGSQPIVSRRAVPGTIKDRSRQRQEQSSVELGNDFIVQWSVELAPAAMIIERADCVAVSFPRGEVAKRSA